MIIAQTGVTPSVSRLWVSVRSGHCRYGVKTNQRSDKFGEPSTPVSRRGNRFEYFAARRGVESTEPKHETHQCQSLQFESSQSCSIPPGRLRLVVSLDFIAGKVNAGLSLVSLWDERNGCCKTKAPLVRLPTRACHAGRHRYFWGVIDSTSSVPRTECPPHTEINDTSERNLETKFSERVAGYHRSFI